VTTNPVVLNVNVLEDLQMLSAYLRDESDERLCARGTLSLHANLCKEALMTIDVLVPKLRALNLQAQLTARAQRVCVNCD
jgi:hypothetical protein